MKNHIFTAITANNSGLKINDNNALVIGILGDQLNMEIMVPQRAKKSPKTSE